MEITEFIAARLAEREAAAKAAPGDHWQAFTEDDIAGASVYDDQWVLLYPERYDHDESLSGRPEATGPQYIQRSRDALAAHIALNDPARVLREVEAKRAILAEHQPGAHLAWNEDERACQRCGDVVTVQWPCPTLGHLAAIDSDHPDYNPAWTVGG